MAKKKPEKRKEEAMQAETQEPAAQAGRKPGRKPGPFWHTVNRRWVARIGGNQFTAPEKIGETDVAGARAWYQVLAVSLGVSCSPKESTPTNSEKRTWTITRYALEAMRELAPLIADERMLPRVSESYAASIAIVEALAARKAKEKDKG